MSVDSREGSDQEIEYDGRLDPSLYNSQRCFVRDFYDLNSSVLEGSATHGSNLHTLLRTLVDISLTRSVNLKGLQRRELSFKNLSLHNISGSYSNNLSIGGQDNVNTRSQEIVVIESIVPKSAQVRFYGIVRHKSVEICPQFLMSLYLFSRFHIRNLFGEVDMSDESFKDENFLHYKLLNGGQKTRSLSYSQQYKAATKLLKVSGNSQIDRLGKLATTHLNNDPELGAVQDISPVLQPSAFSVSALNIDVLCQYAGFTDRSSYNIRRAGLEPPASVVSQIFPFLDSMSLSSDGSFFCLLDMLRKSLVQDVAELKLRHPDSFIFGHPIFFSDEFNKFVERYRKYVLEGASQPITPSSSSVSSQICDSASDNSRIRIPPIIISPCGQQKQISIPSTPSSNMSVKSSQETLSAESCKSPSDIHKVEPRSTSFDNQNKIISDPPVASMASESNNCLFDNRIEQLEGVIDGLVRKQEMLFVALDQLNNKFDTFVSQHGQAVSSVAASIGCFGVLSAAKNGNNLHHIQHLISKTSMQLGIIQKALPGSNSGVVLPACKLSKAQKPESAKRSASSMHPMTFSEPKRQCQS